MVALTLYPHRRQPMRASSSFSCLLAVTAAATVACDTVAVHHDADREAARADRLFDRGWVPDVLPASAGPSVEAHDVDTNERCARAQFAPELAGVDFAGVPLFWSGG